MFTGLNAHSASWSQDKSEFLRHIHPSEHLPPATGLLHYPYQIGLSGSCRRLRCRISLWWYFHPISPPPSSPVSSEHLLAAKSSTDLPVLLDLGVLGMAVCPAKIDLPNFQ